MAFTSCALADTTSFSEPPLFIPAPNPASYSGAGAGGMAAGDFNRDGKLDLAVGNPTGNSVSISLGNGQGGFTPGASVPVGSSPTALATGDFNGDGKLDIVSANYGSGNATVLLGKGDGTFTPAPGSPVTLGAHPRNIVVADFNGDGHPDLAATTDAGVVVLLGTGTGAFNPAPGSPFTQVHNPAALAAGFFEVGAVAPDLAVVDAVGDTVSILHNNGHGTFTLQPGSPVPDADPGYGACQPGAFCLYNAISIAAGDFRGGGLYDVAVGHYDGKVSVLLGNGKGGLSVASGSPFPARAEGRGTAVQHVITGYFNNDSNLDLATSDYSQGGCSNPPCDLPFNSVSVLLGDGRGGFNPASGSSYSLSGVAGDIVSGDFNHDNRLDLAATDLYSCHGNVAQVLLNQGASGGLIPPADQFGGDGCSGGCPPRFIPGKPEPGLVAIFVDGVQTQNPQDDFYPLDYGFSGGADHPAIDSYCTGPGGKYRASSSGPYPPSVSDAISGYYGTIGQPPALGSKTLTDTLAKQGAVLLPYSYKGAGFSSCGSGGHPPLFHANASGNDDPGNTDVNTEAGYLYGEVLSIHNCWPDSAIDIVANSGGGVPAEYYWNTAFQSEHDGVKHIFTEDSPINGLDHTLLESIVDNHLGNVVRDFYGQLWNNLDAVDKRETALDGDGSFRPIGTVGDYAYAIGDQHWSFNFDPQAEVQNANYMGLLSQVLMDCTGGAVDNCSAVTPPSYISPCDASDLSGDDSHELVRICKPTVDYIAGIAAGDLNAAETVHKRSPALAAGVNPLAQTAAGPPFRLVRGPGPAVHPLLYAATPGSRITLRGTALGTAPGRVLFSGTSGAAALTARLISWTDSAVTVVVPDAVSGPIIAQTAAGAYFPAGGLAALSRGRVRHLEIRTSPPEPAGQPGYVYVTALDRHRHRVRHAGVSLFNGGQDQHAVTNRRGIATFQVRGSGVQLFLVHSQGTHDSVRLRWIVPSGSPFTTVGVSLIGGRIVSGGRLVLSLAAGLPGSLTATTAICGTQRGACRRTTKFGTGLAVASAPGTLSTSIKPSAPARRKLRRHHRFRIQIQLVLRVTATRATITRRYVISVGS
jgi:hypothetical protein